MTEASRAGFEPATSWFAAAIEADTIKRLKEKNYELLEYSGGEGDKDSHLMVDIHVGSGAAPQK